MTTYIFPGQGSQSKGMGKELFAKYPYYLEMAESILNYSLIDLCLEDPYELLNHTKYAQPALYVVGVLNYLETLNTTKEKPNFVIGHSLGEYIALFCAGVFDFETGLKLVQKRGELLSQIKGGKVAVIGGLRLEKICDILIENSLSTIEISCHNAPTQVSIAGPKKQLQNLERLFKKAGAFFYTELNISIPFHSSYMKPAQRKFAKFLPKFVFHRPKIKVIANVTALPYEGNDIKYGLLNQISSPVKWSDSICYLFNHGEEKFIELGPTTKKYFIQLLPEIKAETKLLSKKYSNYHNIY